MSGTNREDEKDARRRMEARAKLNDPNVPPVFIMASVEPRWENGRIVQPPIRCDSRLAKIGDREIHREPDESYEEFQKRVASYLPANGGPYPFIIMIPVETELSQKPATAEKKIRD